MKIRGVLTLFVSILSITGSFAQSGESTINAIITPQVSEVAKKNENWKLALVTGQHAQVVLMSITPKTNPKNEIGIETHPFDQVILVVEGEATSDLNGKKAIVKSGDMIFIPQGVPHNFINLSMMNPFKIISVYSATDIPANARYKQKSDAPEE